VTVTVCESGAADVAAPELGALDEPSALLPELLLQAAANDNAATAATDVTPIRKTGPGRFMRDDLLEKGFD
jgi:hypothetical protein